MIQVTASTDEPSGDHLIAKQVRKLISDVLGGYLNGFSEETVTDQTNLVDDLRMDSLDTVELLMEVEYLFNIDIPDSEAEEVQTVGDAIRVIKGILSASSEERSDDEPPPSGAPA